MFATQTCAIGGEVCIDTEGGLNGAVGHDLCLDLLTPDRVSGGAIVLVILVGFGVAGDARLAALWSLASFRAVWVRSWLMVATLGNGVWLTALVAPVLTACYQAATKKRSLPVTPAANTTIL